LDSPSHEALRLCVAIHYRGGVLVMGSRSHDYTLRLAEKALERIKALALPADPPGYELWYAYASGHNPEMNRRIDGVLHESGALSLFELDSIYEEYLASSRRGAALDQAGANVSREIDKIVGMLGDLILASSQDRDACAHASKQLAQSRDQGSIRAVADAIINSLRMVETRHVAMEQRLDAAKCEMEALQQSLAVTAIEAAQDVVTGLANRRGFNSALEQACERANADATPFCLLMLDIDHFKAFNDRFGHLMGDSVLALIGVTLKQTIKGQDFAARYGGEEFAVILPDTSLRNAGTLAEQIRERIMGRELRRRSTGERLGGITVSIGIACHRPGERPRSIIERADGCLYEAKRAGRNCVRCESESEGEMCGNAA
jgi:diguanylate cyclase